MLTTSRWTLHINNMFMKQDITVQLNVQEDGSYRFFAVTGKGLRPFPSELLDKIKIDGDTMSVELEMPDEKFKGMKFLIEITFEDDKATGFFKLPIFGKLRFSGEKVELTELPILKEKSVDEIMGDEGKAIDNEEVTDDEVMELFEEAEPDGLDA